MGLRAVKEEFGQATAAGAGAGAGTEGEGHVRQRAALGSAAVGRRWGRNAGTKAQPKVKREQQAEPEKVHCIHASRRARVEGLD